MCGIERFLSTTGPRRREELKDAVERMTATMLHRGPDASGVWICPKAQTGLGHRRLSIIDTSDAGTQPFVSSDGRYVISFNGEIYNFLELRPLLEAKGSVFRTRTDTEVLIEAIRHWGPEGLLRLDGMFAFALHDTVTGELLLARDVFGEKPLCWGRWASRGSKRLPHGPLPATQVLAPIVGEDVITFAFGRIQGNHRLPSTLHPMLPARQFSPCPHCSPRTLFSAHPTP